MKYMQVQRSASAAASSTPAPMERREPSAAFTAFQMIICGGCGEFSAGFIGTTEEKVCGLALHQQTGKYRPVLRRPHSPGSTIEQVLVTAINRTLCHKDSSLPPYRIILRRLYSRKRPNLEKHQQVGGFKRSF